MPQHTPVAEQQRLVARWRRSQQSMSAFARSVGVAPSTFSRWIHRTTPESTAVTPTPSFIEVSPVSAPASFSVQLELQGQSALELTFEAPPAPTWFAMVLREVMAC